MKRVDRDFSVAEFAHGARSAYEMIVMAYENGDLETLSGSSPRGLRAVRAAIDARKAKGYSRRGELRRHPRGEAADAHFDPATSQGDITMRFVGELTSVVRDPEGRIVEGAPNELKQQKDVWTFSRNMASEDPNWLLAATGG